MTGKHVKDVTEANLKAAAKKAGIVDLDGRISKEFLAEELLQAVGLAHFIEEYGDQFIGQEIRVFPIALIEQALDDPTVTPLFHAADDDENGEKR
jgi:hypothetical protein